MMFHMGGGEGEDLRGQNGFVCLGYVGDSKVYPSVGIYSSSVLN